MKQRIGALLWLVCWNCCAVSRAAPMTPATWTLKPVSSLHKLTAISPGVLEKFPITPVQLRAARGEWECFQLVITAGDKPLNEIRLGSPGLATHLGENIPAANVQLFWQHFVEVTHPSGNRRLDSLWWPDALIPVGLQPVKSLEAHRSLAVWCAVRVPVGTPAGQYFGPIDVVVDGQARELAVTLQVEAVDLPAPTMRANVAVYYDLLRDWYMKNLGPLDDAQFARLKKNYYEFLLDYHLNAYDLPVPWSSPEAEAYLRDDRVRSVRLPPLDAPDFQLALDVLKRTNTLDKAYYYHIDEPPPERFAEVRATTQKLHAIDARLKQCVTVHPNQSLESAVDIWCPNIGDFAGLGHLDLEELARQRALGRETWLYTMVEPKNPYPTWLLDDDASSVRVYGWMMARWGFSGFVYSMAHGWGPKPLENLQSFAGTNGDGTLLYPAELVGGVGPMPSIRLMLLRDAIEDYELLKTLPPQRHFSMQELFGDTPHDFYASSASLERMRDVLFMHLKGQAELGWDYWDIGKNAVPTSLDWITNNLRQSGRTVIVGSADGDADIEGDGRAPRLTEPPTIDGWIHEAPWNARSRWIDLHYLSSLTPMQQLAAHIPNNRIYTAHDTQNLYIAVRVRQPASSGEWIGVEIAPLKADERWRFVVTQKGNIAVEHHTREGQFRVEGLDWKGATKSFNGFYDVEMKIPLSLVHSAKTFRFNALRRTATPVGTRLILRAHADAGDVTLMPLITLQ